MGLLRSLCRWWDGPERIHPYYEKKLLEADTFLNGKIIALNYTALEQIAEKQNAKKMSVLFFSPLPIDPISLRWNDPKLGVDVFGGLLVLVEKNETAFHRVSQLHDELEKVHLALRQAVNQRSRFTLVRRVGSSTNALVWERGQGHI